MRLVCLLTEIQGSDFPFCVDITPDDNFGKEYNEKEMIWGRMFRTEKEAKNFIRDIHNAPILRRTLTKEGKLTRDEYVQRENTEIELAEIKRVFN